MFATGFCASGGDVVVGGSFVRDGRSEDFDLLLDFTLMPFLFLLVLLLLLLLDVDFLLLDLDELRLL